MRVNELFVSVQGEGPGSGRRACFVRFSGCNLSCSFCDSKYALQSYIDVGVDYILQAILRTKCKYVVLTGGEPLMQPELYALVGELVANGIAIDIETNGTIIEGAMTSCARYIVSPKDDIQQTIVKWLAASCNVIFKLVVNEDTIESTIAMCKELNTAGVWFMPITDVNQPYGKQMYDMARMGRLITNEMNNQHYDGYVCTRLQNFYRVR